MTTCNETGMSGVGPILVCFRPNDYPPFDPYALIHYCIIMLLRQTKTHDGVLAEAARIPSR